MLSDQKVKNGKLESFRKYAILIKQISSSFGFVLYKNVFKLLFLSFTHLIIFQRTTETLVKNKLVILRSVQNTY